MPATPHDIDEAIMFAIGSTEPSTFDEFCTGLRMSNYLPFDRSGWGKLFGAVRLLESQRLITVTREHAGAHHIQTLMLTEAGAAKVRDRLDSERGLFKSAGLL